MNYPKIILHWIGGKEATTSTSKFFDKYDPASGSILSKVIRGNEIDARQAVESSKATYNFWSGMTAKERSKVLLKCIQLMVKRKNELAEIVSIESGKSKKASVGEVGAAINCGLFFVKEGLEIFKFREPLVSAVAGRRVEMIRGSVGTGALITPFNNPVAGIAWKLFPALLCGNTVVIKSHEYTPYVALWYARVLKDAGLVDGVVNVIQGFGGEVGIPLIKDNQIEFVSFTGSYATGAKILKNTADRLAKVSIEAGGKNPFVVCSDADLDRAAKYAVDSAFVDAGQRCAAASRIIVFDSIYNKFKKIFLDNISKLKVGIDEGCDYGAMISKKRMDSVLSAINGAIKRGAKLSYGGRRIKMSGYFIEPTVLENISMDDKFSQEEIFGPVVALYRAENFEEAVSLANNSKFKLSGAIHTKSKKQAKEFIRLYKSGVVRVNGPTHGSEPHMPFGGVGLSGNGWREPGSKALDFYSDWRQVSYEYE